MRLTPWSIQSHQILKNYSKIISLLFIMMSVKTNFAQTNNDSIINQKNTRNVQFTIGIPIWFPGLNRTLSIGEITLDSEEESKDIFTRLFDSETNVDYYFVGKLGVVKDKWQLQGDVFGGRFRNATSFTHNQIPLDNIEVFTTMPRLFLGYQLFDQDYDRRRVKKRLELWPYVGLRFFYVNASNRGNTVIPDFNVRRNWLDPLIGFNIELMLNRFTIAFENDLGGFGLGSNLTYWFQLSGEYRIVNLLAFKLGWIYQNINYSDDNRKQPFTYKVVLQGPLAEIIFNF